MLKTQTLLAVFESELGYIKDDIEIGESTYCKSCGQHIAAGECDCGGKNKERQRIRSHLTEVINYLKQK